jgi:hypothetical protein
MKRFSPLGFVVGILAAGFALGLMPSAVAQPIPAGGLRAVVHDGTLSGSGTTASPLTVIGGAGVTGTGTNNTTTKWTGVSTIGNANPTDDGTTFAISELASTSYSGAAQAADRSAFLVTNSGSYNTTAAGRTAYGINSNVSATRSSGANNLTNIALAGTASGGQVNYSLKTFDGDVILNDLSGTLTCKGATTHSAAQGSTVVSVLDAYTGQTVDENLLKVTESGTFNPTAATRTVRGIDVSVNAASTSGVSNAVNRTGIRSVVDVGGTAGSGDTNTAVEASATGGTANYAIHATSGNVLVDNGLTVTGNTTLTGNLTANGNTTLGDAASDVITFNNGPIGVNGYGGLHLEWTDEWQFSNNVANGAQYGDWTCFASGTGAACTQSASTVSTGRPGIQQLTTGTTTTGRAAWGVISSQIDFGSMSAKWEDVVGVPTLSTSAEEYAILDGFLDTVTSVNNVDGCYFVYDRGNVLTAPGTGTITANQDKWQCWCASNSTRTGYTMDGSTVSQESFTTVNAPVAAVAWPSTNVAHLKIVMTGTTRAEFYVNGVKSCDINTNIPSGTARMQGWARSMIKSAGTTARTLDYDFTLRTLDLNSARTP